MTIRSSCLPCDAGRRAYDAQPDDTQWTPALATARAQRHHLRALGLTRAVRLPSGQSRYLHASRPRRKFNDYRILEFE